MPEGLLDGTENQSQPDPLIDVFTPEGHKAKLPQSQYQDALRNRYEPAVRVTSPEGKAAWVPRSKAGAAITSGQFKLGPPEQQKLGGGEVQAPGDKSGVHSTAPASSGLLGVSSGFGLPESEHPIRDIADSTQIIKPDTTLKAAAGAVLNPVLYAAKTGKGIVDASVEHFKQAGKDLQDSGIPVSDMVSRGGNLAQPQGVPMQQAVQSALSEVGKGRTWDQLSAQEQELVKGKALHAASLPERSATGEMNFPLAMRSIAHAAAGAFPIIGPAAYEAGTEIGEAAPKGDVDAMLHGAGKGVGLIGGLLLGTEKGQAATEAAIPKIARPVARGAELVQSGTGAIASKIGEIARPNSALEPVPAAIKSLKPRNSIPNIKDTLASALPDARRAADNLGIEVKTLDDGQKAVTQAKKDIWNEYQARLGPNTDAVIDGNRVADAMESTITKRFEQQNPTAAQAIRDKAAAYRKPISLSDAEDFLQDANNELSSYYAKNKVSRRVVARDSSTGHTVAEADALRNGIYGKLDELTGPGAADLKRRYGALATMEDILQRRINVADRAAPESLIEQMGSMRAAGKIAKGVVTLPFTPVRAVGDIVEGANNLRAARASRLANDSNALLEHAFNKTDATPAAQPYIAPPRPPIRGLLPPAPTELPAATEPIHPGREGLLPAAHRVDENGKVQYLTSPAEPGAEPSPIAKPSQDERGIKAPQKRTFLRSSDQDVKEFYNYRFDQLRGEIKSAQASGDANALADAERRLKALDEVQRAHPRSEPEEAVTPTIARPGAGAVNPSPEQLLPIDLNAARNKRRIPPDATAKADLSGQTVPAKAPTFFSKAEKVAEEKLPNTVSASQVLSTLQNAGVKAEELKWLGLDDYLKGKDKVSKADLLDHIRQNNVQVKEVMKGAGKGKPPLLEQWEHTPATARDNEYWETPEGYRVIGTQHGGYILDRVNQEELVAGSEDPYEQIGMFGSRQEAQAAAARDYHGDIGTDAKFSQYQLPGGENYRELLLTLPSKLQTQAETIGASTKGLGLSNDFRSSHFDEPNVLAHIRFNDRISPDGKKTLFLEELQSDWHQKGRREGYVQPLPKPVQMSDGKWTLEFKNGQRMGEYENQSMADLYAKDFPENRGVPDAPFKSTWHELAMKRMLRYAAENGYDKLAWTTGEQQAARYDLSKQVNAVQWEPKTQKLKVELPSGDMQYVGPDKIPASELEKYVGKDVAAKLTAPGSVKAKVNGMEIHEVRGDDLKVGGLGMKGFYDKILPDFMNKYGKKWGAKVGTSDVSVGPDEKAYREAERSGDSAKIGEAMGGKAKVHSIDITPSMKHEVIFKGQPISRNDSGSEAPGKIARPNQIRGISV